MKIWTAVLRFKHFEIPFMSYSYFIFIEPAAYCLLHKLNTSTVRFLHTLLIEMNTLVVIFAYSDCPEYCTSAYVVKYKKCLNSYYY